MPKPHYPPQGGPHLPAWARPVVRLPESPLPSEGKAPPPDAGKRHEREARTVRLQPDLMRTPEGLPAWLASHPGKGSVKMVWVALGVCGAVMLFALVALLRHG